MKARASLLVSLSAVASVWTCLVVGFYVLSFFAGNEMASTEAVAANDRPAPTVSNEDGYFRLFVLYLSYEALVVMLSIACFYHGLASANRCAQDARSRKGLYRLLAVYKFILLASSLSAIIILLAFLGFMLLFSVLAGPPLFFLVLYAEGYLAPLAAISAIPIIHVLAMTFTTSSYSISAILIVGKQKKIHPARRIIYVALQCLPIVECVSYPFIVRHLRRLDPPVSKIPTTIDC